MSEKLLTQYLVCENITKKASSTFYLGASIFPKNKRKYIWAIYAFCRHADDLVDESGLVPTEIARRLATMTELIEQVNNADWQVEFYSDEIRNIAFALRDTFQQNKGLHKEPFVRLIEGVSIDLYKKNFLSNEELEEYCDKVAGGVGEIICALLGINDLRIVTNARKMGNAMQLTNILRDIGEDQMRGRVYIPQEKLDEYRIELPFRESLQLKKLIADLVDATHREYRVARKSFKVFPLRIRFALNVAAYLYEGILEDIAAHDFRVLDRRAHVSGLKKTIIAVKSLLASLF